MATDLDRWPNNHSSTGQALQQAIWLDNYPVALINAPAAVVPEVAYIQPDHRAPREWSLIPEVLTAPTADTATRRRVKRLRQVANVRRELHSQLQQCPIDEVYKHEAEPGRIY